MIKYILFFVALSAISCKDEKSIEVTVHKEKKETTPDRLFTVDTFTQLPPEIDGCSCYFSNDSIEYKAEKYFYVDTFTETSFVKLNGKLLKFNQTSHVRSDSVNYIYNYESTDYIMKVELKEGKETGDESWSCTGKIIITNRKGIKVTKKFYGECGC